MPTTAKQEQLRETARKAIDAIVSDPELDDDTKEEILEELQNHLEDGMQILSGEDDEEEEDEDDEDEDEDEEDE